ncbi:MAG: Wadjet anti-phage system protein JetD domain-containing protein [Dethiobacteraceae bacterium]|jgi:hypothetical protein
MDYCSFLLNTLLDKYETSAHFFETSRVNRRVAFPFNRSTIPVYFAGDQPQDKHAIHQAVLELQTAGILQAEWQRGEKGNLLKRTTLNLQHIAAAYRMAGRTPKADQLAEQLFLLSSTASKIQTPWILETLASAQNSIRVSRTIPAPFPNTTEQLELFLKVLSGLDDKKEGELSERIFSIYYLGHSKLFTGKTRSALITLARRRFSDPDLSDEDILAELGIVKTSTELLIAGPLTITIDGIATDLTPLTFGAVIDTSQISRICFANLHVDTILLIENKTNFHELVRKGLSKHIILIYLGGFPGPGKRQLLAALNQQTRATTQIYHWGDIDWGGFRIHRILKETAFPNIRPLFMDEATLLSYRHMTDTLHPSYAKRLEKLSQDTRYNEFHTVIQTMLAYNLRLEQEALLADEQAIFLIRSLFQC